MPQVQYASATLFAFEAIRKQNFEFKSEIRIPKSEIVISVFPLTVPTPLLLIFRQHPS